MPCQITTGIVAFSIAVPLRTMANATQAASKQRNILKTKIGDQSFFCTIYLTRRHMKGHNWGGGGTLVHIRFIMYSHVTCAKKLTFPPNLEPTK